MDKRGSAVVIGGSMAGLVSARVLADAFEKVTVIERDPLLTAADFRPGVPQGFHLHLLLARGREVLEQLFPGFDGALDALGAPLFDLLCDTEFVTGFGPLFRAKSKSLVRSASRRCLEWEVRQRVAALPNVAFVDNAAVTGLRLDSEKRKVEGVELNKAHGEAASLSAELVVDASGRTSRAVEWLEAHGLPRPAVLGVNSHLSYSTGWFERTELPEKRMALVAGTRAPDLPRAGLVLPIEGNQMLILLAAYGEKTPTEERAFLEFSKTLLNVNIAATLEGAKPLSPIKHYGRTDNQWRTFHRLEHLPEGFVPIGDALCSFNPFYGQGMTVAALEAVALGEELARGRDGLARRAQKRFAKIVDDAWMFATNEDYRWPTTEGPPVSRATRMVHGYIDHVAQLSVTREIFASTYANVAHMMEPATALFRPAILLPILGRVARGVKPRQTAQRPS